MTPQRTPSRPIGDRTVPALGVGTWALGGEWSFAGRPAGWGAVDDDVSVAALRAAYDCGVRLVDTADVYGCGHSERVVGRAVRPFRDDVLIATKVGLIFEEGTRTGSGEDLSVQHVLAACDASLRRLGVDHIDLLQIHPGGCTASAAAEAVQAFEQLVEAGKIRAYGTSATGPDVIATVAAGGHGVSVQQQLNVFGADEPALAACDEHELAVLVRTPLAMGLLSGRYRTPEQLPVSDVRRNTPWLDYFYADRMPEWLARLDAMREILTSEARTLVQGALAYVWARSPRAIALPGVRTPEQARELAGALPLGPLTAEQVVEIDLLVGAPSAV